MALSLEPKEHKLLIYKKGLSCFLSVPFHILQILFGRRLQAPNPTLDLKSCCFCVFKADYLKISCYDYYIRSVVYESIRFDHWRNGNGKRKSIYSDRTCTAIIPITRRERWAINCLNHGTATYRFFPYPLYLHVYTVNTFKGACLKIFHYRAYMSVTK